MDLIMNYSEDKKPKNLLYLAKPIYGGWVTFTAHLSKKYEWPIYKITKKTEKNMRDYGYECQYHNICLAKVLSLDKYFLSVYSINLRNHPRQHFF